MQFGDILRQLIDERNLTQKQLGADLNIAPTTIGNYVRNEREPDYATLKTFAKYFHVSIDFLLDNSIDTPTSTSEKMLLNIFRSVEEEHRKILLEQAKALFKVTKNQ